MKSVLLCCAVGALLALPATPQSLELGISGGYGTPSDNTLSVAEYLDAAGQDEFSISNGVRIGGRMAFNSWRFIGHEVSYAYQHAGLDFLSDSSDGSSAADLGAVKVHHMYYNLVAHALPEGSPIRPFVTGGGGFSSFFLPGVSSFSGYGNTKFGYNYGGGVKFNFFLYGVRLDVRNHVTGKPFGQHLPNVTGTLNNLEFSLTFSVLLG